METVDCVMAFGDLKVQDIKKILKQKNKAPKSMGEFNGEKIFLKTGRFGPYIQYEKVPEIVSEEVKKNRKKKKKES